MQKTREKLNNIFLSYSGGDAFEANLLQFAFEELMKDKEVKRDAFLGWIIDHGGDRYE